MTAQGTTKPPARRDVPDQPDEPEDDNAPQILVLSSKKDAAPERKQVPLFELDGKTYTVDQPQPPNVGLKYLHKLNHQGTQVAYAYMLEAMLGEDGYEALMGYDKLKPEHLDRLVDDALNILLGSHEGPKGPQRKRRRR
ncbi:MAG: hypothetical protein ACRDP5_24075 [Streptosporangiaceae bacterium]